MTRTLNINTATYKYRCKLTGTDGSVVYTDVIHFAPILITKQPESVTASIGDTVTFSVVAQGNSLTYQWQWCASGTEDWRNTSVPGNQTDAITLEATTARNGYRYRCGITDASGNTITSNAATLTVTSA